VSPVGGRLFGDRIGFINRSSLRGTGSDPPALRHSSTYNDGVLKMSKSPTRRDVQRLSPEILGHYHDLLMAYDVDGFDKMLEMYEVPEEEREEHRREFKHYAERILRQRWQRS
jgi:hypothetical protein